MSLSSHTIVDQAKKDDFSGPEALEHPETLVHPESLERVGAGFISFRSSDFASVEQPSRQFGTGVRVIAVSLGVLKRFNV